MTDRYPPGGCVLRDKTKCKLPRATCCDHGRAVRWPDANLALLDPDGHCDRTDPHTHGLAAESTEVS